MADVDIQQEEEQARAWREVARQESKFIEIDQEINKSLAIKEKIEDAKFTGSTFYSVLFLSLLKDFVDLISLGTIGVVLNIFVSIYLALVFFMKKSFLKRMMMKMFIWPMIVEFIPGISAFPTYTVATFMLKMKSDKMVRELNDELLAQEAKIKELKKQIA